MAVFIALYRGINVVGKNLVKMEALRALHERLGHEGVQSYIASGNVVFSAKGSANVITRAIAEEFATEFDFGARVMVVEAKRWGSVVKENPYAKFAAQNPHMVHAGICDGKPSTEGLKALLTRTGGRESFVAGKGVVYLHAPDGFGTSKFAAGMEKACGVPMTVRNWRTVEALLKILNAEA